MNSSRKIPNENLALIVFIIGLILGGVAGFIYLASTASVDTSQMTKEETFDYIGKELDKIQKETIGQVECLEWHEFDLSEAPWKDMKLPPSSVRQCTKYGIKRD